MKTLLASLFVCGITISMHAQAPDTLKYCVDIEGVGVGGYDPVSYFQGTTPKVANAKFVTKYEGVTYAFASEANRKKFMADPQKYLPAFGGWCSMTLAMGRATTPKYDNFAIIGGKLYLFERTLSVNGRELWLKDTNTNEARALSNYDEYRTTGKISK